MSMSMSDIADIELDVDAHLWQGGGVTCGLGYSVENESGG
jgi:hypothetical protein